MANQPNGRAAKWLNSQMVNQPNDQTAKSYRRIRDVMRDDMAKPGKGPKEIKQSIQIKQNDKRDRTDQTE